MKSDEKTNVMRLLDSRKIPYAAHTYAPDPALSGEDIARILGEDPSYVFKTLVTRGKTGRYYVFVIPVAAELNLKKAAAAAGEKSVEMIHQKELLPLTGYVHGGCSPVGMKKKFPTCIDETAVLCEKIYVSAGQRGLQLIVNPEALRSFLCAKFADLIR